MLLLLSAVILACMAAAIGLFYYVFSIPEPEGMSIAAWPQVFTDSFASWVTCENGELSIEQIGLERLDKYGLWIQFLDESGQEIFAHNKPADYPDRYTASWLLSLGVRQYENGYTLFAGSLTDSRPPCSYIIGFPYDIGKYMLYYNGSRVSRLSPVARGIVFSALGILVVSVLAYGFWLSRRLSEITDGIKSISLRSYKPLREQGMFRDVYCALNKTDQEIRRADQISTETETKRREWIANITHDLKTPLSPVKGYAEILADGSAPNLEAVQEYAGIILKNVNHAERLINDLKLTYQLESGFMPFHPTEIKIACYVKEWIIDIVNDPAFADREITFESRQAELTASLDPDLFRRAVTNLVSNALIHNPPGTKVDVMLDVTEGDELLLTIRDNGRGLSESEQAGLFERYYRGTNTKEKPEGSGLGLAIANQIVILHGGRITVKSFQKAGTEFTVHIPLDNATSSPTDSGN